MRLHLRFRTSLLSVVAALLAIACGDDSTTSEPNTSDGDASTATDDASTETESGDSDDETDTDVAPSDTDAETEDATDDETEVTDEDGSDEANEMSDGDATDTDEPSQEDGGARERLDGGDASMDTDGGEPEPPTDDPEADAGDAGPACTPLSNEAAPDVPDGGSGDSCFPSCIAELEAHCLPSATCATNSAIEPSLTCWDNGTQLSYTEATGLSITATSALLKDGQPCYSVVFDIPFPNPGTYIWKDNCGNDIATGAEDALDPALVTITCLENDEQAIVDLTSPACAGHENGAPSTTYCSDDLDCEP